MNNELIIPNRFESVLSSQLFENYTPLLLPVETDLTAIKKIADKTTFQNGGILTFILGNSGVGKTTSIYAASIFMKELFNSVFNIPSDIPLRDVIYWLNNNIPKQNKKKLLVLFDGREINDDEVGLSQFLTGLNQLLRKRKDVLFCWPTTDQDWQTTIKETAHKIGGSNFVPRGSDLIISGLPKTEWNSALERILIRLDLTLDDISLPQDAVDQYIEEGEVIGDFLGNIRDVMVERVFDVKTDYRLPEIVFVVSSGVEVVGEANRLRRAGSLVVKAEELINYSPRSRSGKFWSTRLSSPEQHLAYIISLFNVRLTTVGPSVVAYSCLHFGNSNLKKISADEGLQENLSNAKVTLKASDFYKYLEGTTTNEMTSTRKGKVGDATTNSYDRIQLLSATNHKEINKAICDLVSDSLSSYEKDKEKLEVDQGDQNLYTDAIIVVNGEEKYLEFHHLSSKNCKASKISSYIMEKLQYYAIHYNLVPR
ncbi:hypothetical protein [Haliscomenobacter sp.]|uniref:hypothetical protein n=1 Tax=Haliscomenobacter sp. TaxID=2717303 RepID=UPI003BA99A67